jgi:hypothetical protein
LVGVLMGLRWVGRALRRQGRYRLGSRDGGKGLEHSQHSNAGCEEDRRQRIEPHAGSAIQVREYVAEE